MAKSEFPRKGVAVPGGRLSRLARFGGMATNVAGGMLLDGARQMAQGRRPSVSDLLLTPANAIKVTQQLANLRGAAMKIGQLVSMDAGDMLPPELADVFGRLRADAQHMPKGQLYYQLTKAWGRGWQDRFEEFGEHPIAAASIGQVHRARTKDGRDLAIKVQYPGVRRSIDSDVNNVASLLKISGLLPKTMDITPMLAEAKRQLHEEADYVREAECLSQFGSLLDGAADFIVPEFHADFSSENVLAMSFVDSVPVESLTDAPQEERDRIIAVLVTLLMRELFDFNLMQTDPNFANYRYCIDTGQLVLLDFGATRAFLPATADAYRRLMRAGLTGDTAASRDAAIDIGFFDARTPRHHQDSVMAMFDMAMEPLRTAGVFDFGNNDVALRLRDEGVKIASDRQFWHIPPMDTLFIQRKFGGIYLLATRLKARVDVRSLMESYL